MTLSPIPPWRSLGSLESPEDIPEIASIANLARDWTAENYSKFLLGSS
jgi:hypothetical protein